MVAAMQPRTSAARRILVLLAAVAGFTLLAWISLPLAGALPLIFAVAAGVVGGRERHRRRAQARR